MDEVHGLSGSVLVLHGPEVVMRVSAGTADTGTGAVCTSETRFQVGSVSKQFTAAAAMLLVEDGALAVDDPIAESLPGCPPRWRHVTLHHLLSHTSGLGHWPELPGFDTSAVRDADEFLERFATVPLRGAPGTAWRHSSPGYLLVARIVEQISGHRYGDFVTERILRPLGCRRRSRAGSGGAWLTGWPTGGRGGVRSAARSRGRLVDRGRPGPLHLSVQCRRRGHFFVT
ncbi:serine hydrolase domain-containing protein [Streptomyces sp. NPDC054802]